MDACTGFRKGIMHHTELMPKDLCVDAASDVLPALFPERGVRVDKPPKSAESARVDGGGSFLEV